LGGAPQLRNEEIVYSGTDKYRLKTITTGKIFVQLSIIFKDFGKYGLNW
jgi:B9 domain-containing protein 2